MKNSAYAAALKFAKEHYENFPVVSFLVPKKLQKHIAIIYWFARTADDLADEGNISVENRIENLNNFELRLNELLKGNYHNEFEEALSETIKEKSLTAELFYDLLSAFRQDIKKKSYKKFDDILDYCSRSANPVGRLILELYDIRNKEAFIYSDNICTGLQLANFYQDISIDIVKGRVYFAEDEMDKFSISRNMFEKKENNANLRQFLIYNVNRADDLLRNGEKLLKYLNGRLKLEIKWTINGGREILKKIEKNSDDIFSRPKLSKIDFIKLLLNSIR